MADTPEKERFMDQKRRIATEQEVAARWGDQMGLYCYLCNHKFTVGEGWRWVYANGMTPAYGNFMVCDGCDGPDVLERWQAANDMLYPHMQGHDNGHWPTSLAAELSTLRAAAQKLAELHALLAELYALAEHRKILTYGHAARITAALASLEDAKGGVNG